MKRFYEKHTKQLLLIPFGLLILALFQIGYQTSTTGDFLKKDISLKGGVTLTLPYTESFSVDDLSTALHDAFPDHDLSVRVLKQAGQTSGIIIEADIQPEQADALLTATATTLGTTWEPDDYSTEIIGSALSESFFKQTMIALAISFLFMGIVVFLYFRTTIPSLAVILAAFSDIVVTLAIANILDIKLSTAGIAAFLMLIGYSVDTDILLSTRVLKRRDGTLNERIYSAMKTGLMMNATTLVAITIALIISTSPTITQIMLILFIGLLVDLINTWIQNVGLLKLYMRRKGHD